MGQKKILVVEDDELNLKLINRILTREGYRVIAASDAESGLALARADIPHLILMDVKLRGMDGLEATRRIRLDPVLKAVPVLMVTAYAMEEDRRQAEESGCSGYITKPLDLKEFVATVRSFIP